jgi:hypothetical protein
VAQLHNGFPWFSAPRARDSLLIRDILAATTQLSLIYITSRSHEPRGPKRTSLLPAMDRRDKSTEP